MDDGLKVSKSSEKSKELPYTIEVMRPGDEDEIMSMLKKFFFKDEPLNNSLGLGECKELEDYCLSYVKGDSSFKAVTKDSNKIIGVFINGLIKRRPEGVPAEKAAPSCKHPKFKKILQFMDVIEDHFDIFAKYPHADAVLDGKILSVDTDYRGLGIAAKLTERTLSYCREHEIPIYQVICSSYFSAQVMKKLGFDLVFSIDFKDVKDEQGQQIVCPAAPHVAGEVYIKELVKPGGSNAEVAN